MNAYCVSKNMISIGIFLQIFLINFCETQYASTDYVCQAFFFTYLGSQKVFIIYDFNFLNLHFTVKQYQYIKVIIFYSTSQRLDRYYKNKCCNVMQKIYIFVIHCSYVIFSQKNKISKYLYFVLYYFSTLRKTMSVCDIFLYLLTWQVISKHSGNRPTKPCSKLKTELLYIRVIHKLPRVQSVIQNTGLYPT